MKKIYMILAALTLLSMSLNAQTMATKFGGSMKAPNRAIINVTDHITASALTATGTTYTNFSGVTFTSDAVYAGNSGKSGNNIMLRSRNSTSGIVTTTSGGKVKSITITVGSGTTRVDVYGKNTAYSSAADLYSTTTRGTLLGNTSSTGTITVSGDYAYIGIRSNSGTAYLSSIDVVWEKEVIMHDLSIALSAPAKVVAGNTATLTATVTNTGDYAESGYTVTFTDGNNNVIDTQTGGSLAIGASATFTTTYTTSAAQAGQTLNFTATVTCTGDEDASNNSATASTSVITLPPPENVVATAGENQTATVTWDLPIIATTPATLTWDFEEQSDFNDFTTIDADGDGYNWAWHQNTGSNNLTTNSGDGVIYSESYRNTALHPNNWLISPEVTLGGTLEFYACGQDPNQYWNEVFGVYVCVGSYNGVTDFVQVGADVTTTHDMTKYTYNLSQYQGQGYFAIVHHNVTDEFYLNVDDITYTYAAGNYPISYNVYLDGVLVDNVNSSTFSYTFNNLSSGTHNCAVSAVYTEGESAQVPAVIPTFTPVTNGTVSPSSVDFGTKNIGGSYTAAVTVTNTGNQTFTPTIDVTGLPQGITVSPTSGTVAPNGTLDLTVTFEPTAEQSYSGTFTVTIPVPNDNDIVVTVTVTGSGYYGSKLTSNETEEIPVYKSEVRDPDKYIFTQQEVTGDVNRQLEYDSDIEILVKSDQPITHYNLMHRDGANGTWALVSAAQHQNDKYVAGETEKTFASGETEMWFPMTDDVATVNPDIYYVPVTFADGLITTGNSYGAPYKEAAVDYIDLNISITGSKSSERQGGHWTQNGVEYCVYTPVIHVVSDALDGISNVPYIVRAWLLSDEAYDFDRVNGAIVGTTPLSNPYLLGEKVFQSNEQIPDEIVIGKDWDPTDDVKLQNAFGAPSHNAHVQIVVRAYYQKGAGSSKGTRDGEGGYAFSDGESEANFDLPTGVMEILDGKQIVGVTYVNSLGMQSNEPFDGMNIVVTRYIDGTVTTTKVMR